MIVGQTKNNKKKRKIMSKMGLIKVYTCYLYSALLDQIKKFSLCSVPIVYILSVYSPFSDRVGLPLHNIHIPSPFTSIMDIFFVDLKFGHIHFYTL